MESSNLGSVPEETLEEQHQQDSSKPVFSAFASRPDRPPTQSSSQKYSPLDWAAYFDREEDVCISDSNDVFHLYMAGKEGPVVFCLHGGGYSGMGGSVAVHVAAKKTLRSLAGLVVVDVVEGTAMASLIHMQKILSNRMQHFSSIEKAIEWSVRGGSLRNIDSARVSIPTTLSYDDSKQCYVYRARLEETEQYWRGWYEGLSEKFLSCPVPKVLLLAGTDRLDSRALTIGQMQGKFQMVVVRHTGHAIQEDVPDEFATLILNFISRNRIGPHGVEIPGLGWRAQPRS
ncbi:protein phosphatase methylesterase 1 isoform X5 [Durio zibethinus]|uniref:Protein phosphatase methylesterase 1 n=1 Tax=Durio zibethinus TaxID=66656 RepID=A0A6P5XYL4_DURZI|nr:protein phosphatase methylesterase 1 isoform X5 [Durio zibethinus]